MCVSVGRCTSHIVTAVIRKPFNTVAPASDSRSPPITLASSDCASAAASAAICVGLLALVAGERAGERVEQDVLAMLADVLRQVLVAQAGGEFGEYLGRFSRHVLPFRNGNP